jgi:coenzyme PQQ precursor peptide PqqA
VPQYGKARLALGISVFSPAALEQKSCRPRPRRPLGVGVPRGNTRGAPTPRRFYPENYVSGDPKWRWINGRTGALVFHTMKGDDMTWETPTIEDIPCGMEVTAYAPASDCDGLSTVLIVPAAEASADAEL